MKTSQKNFKQSLVPSLSVLTSLPPIGWSSTRAIALPKLNRRLFMLPNNPGKTRKQYDLEKLLDYVISRNRQSLCQISQDNYFRYFADVSCTPC